MASFLGFFRAPSTSNTTASETSSPTLPVRANGKAVKRRPSDSPRGRRVRPDKGCTSMSQRPGGVQKPKRPKGSKNSSAASRRTSSPFPSWLTNLGRLRIKSEPVDDVLVTALQDKTAAAAPATQERTQSGEAAGSAMDVDTAAEGPGVRREGPNDNSNNNNNNNEEDSSFNCNAISFPTPVRAAGLDVGPLSAALAANTMTGKRTRPRRSYRPNDVMETGEYSGTPDKNTGARPPDWEEETFSDSEDFEDFEDDDFEDDEDVCDDWTELLEGEDESGEQDSALEWEVDEDELEAYESGIAAIEGFTGWTRDEKVVHRLLSLRGFHPLMPAAWTRDFLGVPMYPALFASMEVDRPTVICNKGSQFRATRALRSLFDLQVRVSGLRQTGHTRRIDVIIEKELRRYIAWAAKDSGLDSFTPFIEMPNISAKRFSKDRSSHSSTATGAPRRPQRTLGRRIQDYFREWAAKYRQYYTDLPAFPEQARGGPGSIKREEDDSTAVSSSTRRLRPPRILYGFVIVQHIVMLLAVDAARPGARPRCFADFNMSLGGHWLDASLNVAIPVCMAREAQLRCIQGLSLPTRTKIDSDVDA